MADDDIPQVILPDVNVTPDEPAPEPPLDQAASARMEGYTWPEIDSHLANFRDRAAQFNYTDQEVDTHLGYQDPDVLSHDLQSSARLNTASADEGTHPLEAASDGVLSPSNDPEFPVKVNDLTPDQRSSYADALSNGSAKGPDDFAKSFTDAISETSGHDASPATDAIAAQLPHPNDITDFSLGIAQDAGLLSPDNPENSAAIKAVRENVLNVWAQTGMTPADIYKAVHTEPTFMAALLNPPVPPSIQFPTSDQLSVKTPDIGEPVDFASGTQKIINLFGDTLKDVAYMPGREYDLTQAFNAARAETNEDGTPKYSETELWEDRLLESPSLQLLASLILTKGVFKATDILASPETAATLKDLMTDESGALKPERAAEAGRITTAALLRSAIRQESLPDALDGIISETESPLTKVLAATETKPETNLEAAIRVTEERQQIAGKIREIVGDTTYSKAKARELLEGYFTAVNGQVPSYLNWMNDFQSKMQDSAREKADWIKGGGNPNAFSAIDPTTPEKFTLGKAETIEGQPGNYHTIYRSDGTEAGRVHLTIDGDTANIETISGTGLGNTGLRLLLMQFRNQYPNITKLTGERVTGARAGGETNMYTGRRGPQIEFPLPPKKLTPNVTEDYHPLQTLYDHILNRPGGGRVSPGDPLYPAADEISRVMADRMDKLASYTKDDATGFLRNYFPKLWTDSPIRVKQQFNDVYGKTPTSADIPSIFDGIVRGLTPKFPNPVEGALHFVQAVDDYVATQQVKEWLLDQKAAYKSSGPQNEGDFLLKNTGNLYARRGYAKVFNHWADHGFEKWPVWGKLYQKVLMAKNATLSMSLGLSGFHAVAISLQISASMLGRAFGNAQNLEPFRFLGNVGLAGLQFTGLGQAIKYRKGQRLQNAYMDRPGATELEKQLVEIWKASGGSAPSEGRGEAYWASQGHDLFDSWKQAGSWNLGPVGRGVAQAVGAAAGAVAGAALLGPAGVVPGATIGRMAPVVPTLAKSSWNDLVKAIKGKKGETVAQHIVMPIGRIPEAIAGNFGRVADTVMGPLFDAFIPKVKMAVWADTMEDYLRRNPAAEREQILRMGRQVMDSMDDRFGEMNMRNIFWNPYLKQVLNCALLSLGWEYGTWRATSHATEDLILAPEGKHFSDRLNYLLGAILTAGLAAGMYQFGMTGTSPSRLNFMGVAASGTPAGNIQIPFESKEFDRIYSLMVRAGTNPVKWLQVLPAYVIGKTKFGIANDVQLFLNDPGKGKLMEHLWANHVPIGIQTMTPNLPYVQTLMGIHSAPPELGGASQFPKTTRGRPSLGQGTLDLRATSPRTTRERGPTTLQDLRRR